MPGELPRVSTTTLRLRACPRCLGLAALRAMDRDWLPGVGRRPGPGSPPTPRPAPSAALAFLRPSLLPLPRRWPRSGDLGPDGPRDRHRPRRADRPALPPAGRVILAALLVALIVANALNIAANPGRHLLRHATPARRADRSWDLRLRGPRARGSAFLAGRRCGHRQTTQSPV